MAKFELTATRDMWLGNGKLVQKGAEITINIHQMGITSVNLFNNSRCKDDLLRQFDINGISLPANSPFLNRGAWEIKVIK